MEKQIAALIDTLKTNKKLGSFDKASTKQAIVIRLLSLLGWDIFNVDEVKPDHAVKSFQVDFALRPDNLEAVFVGVEKVGEDLSRSQKELLGCAHKEGVKLAVLTNGVTWWFYLPFSEGAPEQKRFCALELLKQNPRDIAARLVELLEKGSVAQGKALKIAESLQTKRQRKLLEKSMAKAWKRLFAEPHEAVVKLFGETVEKICGFRPDKEMLVTFLTERASSGPPEEPAAEPAKPFVPAARTYEGRVVTAFFFKDDSYKVDAWDAFLLKLCEVLLTKHDQDVEKLLWHSVDNRYYFRENPDELRLPVNIDGTNIFVETHLSPDDTVKIAYSILAAFGYSSSDLEIKTKGK